MKSWWKHLRRELVAERELESSMRSLLVALAPSAELEELPWSADAEQLRWWLFENLDANPPPESADQLWFRLLSSEWRERVDSCDLELSGGEESDRFDVPLLAVTWQPTNPQLGSLILPRLARSEAGHARQLCLCYAALSVQRALRGIDDALLLGAASCRGISVGFKDGPGVHLGRFDGEGWERSELCSY